MERERHNMPLHVSLLHLIISYASKKFIHVFKTFMYVVNELEPVCDCNGTVCSWL